MEPLFPLYLPSDSLSLSHFRLSSVLYNLSLCLWNRDSLLFLSLYLNNTKRRHDDSVSHLSQSLLWIPCSLPPSRSLSLSLFLYQSIDHAIKPVTSSDWIASLHFFSQVTHQLPWFHFFPFLFFGVWLISNCSSMDTEFLIDCLVFSISQDWFFFFWFMRVLLSLVEQESIVFFFFQLCWVLSVCLEFDLCRCKIWFSQLGFLSFLRCLFLPLYVSLGGFLFVFFFLNYTISFC